MTTMQRSQTYHLKGCMRCREVSKQVVEAIAAFPWEPTIPSGWLGLISKCFTFPNQVQLIIRPFPLSSLPRVEAWKMEVGQCLVQAFS